MDEYCNSEGDFFFNLNFCSSARKAYMLRKFVCVGFLPTQGEVRIIT